MNHKKKKKHTKQEIKSIKFFKIIKMKKIFLLKNITIHMFFAKKEKRVRIKQLLSKNDSAII